MRFERRQKQKHARPLRTSLMWGAPAAMACAGVFPTVAWAQLVNSSAFSLEGRAQYDSNVARSSKAAADAVNVDPADIRYTLSANADVGRNLGRSRAILQGSVSYDFYDKNKSLERWRADIRSNVSSRLGPCSGGANVGYLRTLAELSPLSPTDPRDSIEQVLNYGASASCPLVGRIGATAAVQQRQVRTSGSRNQVGSDTTTISSSVGYFSQGFGSLVVIGSYVTTDYGAPNRPIAFAATGAEIYSVGLQYSRPISSRLTGMAGASYFELKRDDSAANQEITGGNTSGMSWNVQLNYRPTQQLSLSGGYADSTSATTRIGSAYQREKRSTLSGSYRLSSRLTANAAVSLVNRDFSGRNAIPGVASKEERTQYGAGLRYLVGRNISVAVDGAITDVQTDQDLANYKSERVSVSVVATF